MDVDDLYIRYRVGRRNGHTIYLGGPDPDETASDLFIGSCRSRGMAHTLVECANVGLAHMNSGLTDTQMRDLKALRELRDAEPFPHEHEPSETQDERV